MRNLALVITITVGSVWGQSPDLIRGTVDGKPVNQAQMEALIGLVPEQLRGAIAGSEQELLRYYGYISRMAEMADKAKLADQSPYKEQLELGRKSVLAAAMIAERSKDLNVTNADVDKYYKDHADEFTTAEVTVVQVPIKNEASAGESKAKADALWKQVQAGADFAALAKEYPVEGDFHTFKKSDAIPAEIKDAVFQLKPGGVTPPVARPNAVFLFRLDKVTVKPLQDARGDIMRDMQEKRLQMWMNEVRKSVVVGK
jgi:parvulin-like peptidyl-prolyl isomerase